ncbi:MAG TPA: M24 family metallopeptidase [Gemmatimonadaceae bacterium]|nr:M24 family metallopeptidase [Gemmatimonadaceae bacterium]
MLTPQSLPRFQRAIAEAGVDGWLLYDFRGLNPVAAGILARTGMATRRVFCLVPKGGVPVAITHAIEQVPWENWPRDWTKHVYSSWRTLEATLASVVKGKRVAMEYSPGDAVPYVDYIPAGVLDMVRAAGAEVVSSGELVSKIYAVWTPEQRASHERAAEVVSRIAHEAFARAGDAARAGRPLTEYELAEWIRGEFARDGLETDHGPSVSVGANAANPHYEADAGNASRIERGQVLLIDLWAREKAREGREAGVYADQTWMGTLGEPSPRAREVWQAIRDARDAAIALLRKRVEGGAAVRGGDVDDASRAVIVERGFGDAFTHRTGHSIDARSLHGSGPHLDNLETREERTLLPGVGFSIEPGVYVRGEIGMRTEVNALVGEGELLITPREIQRELIVV